LSIACPRTLKLGAIIRSYGVEDYETDSMPADSHWDLKSQNMVLGFEIWSYDADHRVESGFWVCRDESWVAPEKLGEARGGEGAFGGDVEGWAGEASRRWQLGSEEEGE
jgi:hypothetical protein